MIYRFRIILDNDEDVFRDIEIENTATLEDFHNVINNSFGFAGQEMASFYTTNEFWEQGTEIPLFDMKEKEGESRVMDDILLKDIVHEDETRLIYIYDFLNMYTFIIELADIAEYESGMIYPNVMFSQGEIPEESPEDEFLTEEPDFDDEDDDYEEDYGLDPEDYDNLDFDENWN